MILLGWISENLFGLLTFLSRLLQGMRVALVAASNFDLCMTVCTQAPDIALNARLTGQEKQQAHDSNDML